LANGLGDRIDRLDHQVDVDRHRLAVGPSGVRPDRLADHRPDGQVRHVMVVHHVEVDPVGAGGDDVPHLLAEPREIGRKNAGGDEGAGHAVPVDRF
jgi:hypothetical protein